MPPRNYQDDIRAALQSLHDQVTEMAFLSRGYNTVPAGITTLAYNNVLDFIECEAEQRGIELKEEE